MDTLHWTVLRKKGREVDAVAIDAKRLRFWLSLCEKAGLNVIQVLPDAILLPVSEGGATLVSCGDSWWLRAAPFSACEADAALMPFLTRDLDGDICCYGDVPSGVVITEQRAWQHPLTLIQPQWKTCRANMLHGPFLASGTHGFRHGKAMLAAAVALSVGLMIGPRIAMAWMLVQQENQAQEEIVQVAQHYFPACASRPTLSIILVRISKHSRKGSFYNLTPWRKLKKRARRGIKPTGI